MYQAVSAIAATSNKPTPEQVRLFERVHKEHFVFLVKCAEVWQEMSRKYAYLPYSDPKKQALLSYGKMLTKSLTRWANTQDTLVKGGVEKYPVHWSLFFDRTKMPYLKGIALRWDAEGKGISGIGIIPLIIWAVIAIVGMFTATKIVDEVNTTTEEREDLMKETEKHCKEMNLSAGDCLKLQQSNQTAASSTGGGGSSLLLLLLVAVLAMGAMKKNNSNSKTNG